MFYAFNYSHYALPVKAGLSDLAAIGGCRCGFAKWRFKQYNYP